MSEEKKHYKFPKIYSLGQEENADILQYGEDFINIEEKVDGGNFSFFTADDGTVFECSRNRNLTTDEDEKTFIGIRIWLRNNLERLEKVGIKINPDYIYYAEAMAKHTINYTNAPNLIGLDIRPKHSMGEEGPGLFLAREGKEKEFARIGIECVPLVWKGTAGELKKMDITALLPQSKYYDGMAEGIVIKNYERKASAGNHQIFAKMVRSEFKECNKAVFGSVRQKNSDTSKIVEEFVTDARVRKVALKLINEEGMFLDMKLMSKVPPNVIKDILEEEFNNIFQKYKFIDFKEFKQRASKRCLSVIKQMMMENLK